MISATIQTVFDSTGVAARASTVRVEDPRRARPLTRIVLVDNGSLEPESTLQLRRMAQSLSVRLGVEVVPASLAHSAKVPAEQLEGRPAELFEAALDRVMAEGTTDVVVLPLFIGPSYAIVRHVPALIAARQVRFPGVRLALAPPLFVPGETRLGQLLAAHIREVLSTGVVTCSARVVLRSEHQSGLAKEGDQDGGRAERVRVAVVDHGSPSRGVTEVRDAVTAQLRELLGDEVAAVAACSMERREGPEYAFNEPLLETLLQQDGWRDGPVIVALLFIAPGKHAGPGGDVAQIVARARGGAIEGVRFTAVLGQHPLLLEILAERAGKLARSHRKAQEG